MFDKSSNLQKFSSALSDNLSFSEYFLGIHVVFDGEVVFAHDVVHVNLDMPAFPVDASGIWDWLKTNLKGTSDQQTFVYELPFDAEDEEDPDMETLIELSSSFGMTLYLCDLGQHADTDAGMRYVIISIPKKDAAAEFREQYHGRKLSPS
jgi:hypothetical protein